MGNIVILAVEKPNQPPLVEAGNAVTIYKPVSEVYLYGQAFDFDGFITKTEWKLVDGLTSVVIESPDELTTLIKNLQYNPNVNNNYVFILTAWDNTGASASDTVTITIENYQVYTPSWKSNYFDVTCITDQYGKNTGVAHFNTLIKVNSDGKPLDANNNLVEETGLSVVTKPNVQSDPDYVADFYDDTACEPYVYKRFRSLVTKQISKTCVPFPTGQDAYATPKYIVNFDNATVIENTIPGISLTTLGNDGSGLILTATEANDYHISFSADGFFRYTSDNAFTFFVDLYATFGGVKYNLKPKENNGFTPAQYALISPGTSGVKVAQVPYNVSYNAVIPMAVGDTLTFTAEIRLQSTPQLRQGIFEWNTNDMQFNIFV